MLIAFPLVLVAHLVLVNPTDTDKTLVWSADIYDSSTMQQMSVDDCAKLSYSVYQDAMQKNNGKAKDGVKLIICTYSDDGTPTPTTTTPHVPSGPSAQL